MNEFGRAFPGIEVLSGLSANGAPHWWNDLLTLWAPAGTPAGATGLRLAVRNGYLNFYRTGQSVARVEVVSGVPRLTVHAKYVLGPQVTTQTYLTLQGSRWATAGAEPPPYQGIERLKSWIGRIDGSDEAKRYAGDEKCVVDAMVGDPANADVIDLEMGLPAWPREGDSKGAPRMDLVVLSPSADRPRVDFWEVKLASDGRVRSRTPVIAAQSPKVLKQLDDYRQFLADPGRMACVAAGYRTAAGLMLRFQAMASDLGLTKPLGDQTRRAAEQGVTVSPRAGLVVVTAANPRAQKSWPKHEERLRSPEADIQLRVMKPGGPFALS